MRRLGVSPGQRISVSDTVSGTVDTASNAMLLLSLMPQECLSRALSPSPPLEALGLKSSCWDVSLRPSGPQGKGLCPHLSSSANTHASLSSWPLPWFCGPVCGPLCTFIDLKTQHLPQSRMHSTADSAEPGREHLPRLPARPSR